MIVLPITAANLLSTVEGLFAGSSYDETHQRIIQWVSTIQGNVQAVNTQGTPQELAYVNLRCWAGDNSAAHVARYRALNPGDPFPNGCGCEVDHGCRADAQTALAQIDTLLGITVPVTSAPIPNNPTATSSSGLPTVTIGVPVSASTVLQSTILGVNVVVWILGVAVLVWVIATRRRRK